MTVGGGRDGSEGRCRLLASAAGALAVSKENASADEHDEEMSGASVSTRQIIGAGKRRDRISTSVTSGAMIKATL